LGFELGDSGISSVESIGQVIDVDSGSIDLSGQSRIGDIQSGYLVGQLGVRGQSLLKFRMLSVKINSDGINFSSTDIELLSKTGNSNVQVSNLVSQRCIELFKRHTSGLAGVQSIGQVRDLNSKALNIGGSISNSLVKSGSLVGESSISLLKLTTSNLKVVAFDGDTVLSNKSIIELLTQIGNGLVQSSNLVR
jgi:hypothetical protein